MSVAAHRPDDVDGAVIVTDDGRSNQDGIAGRIGPRRPKPPTEVAETSVAWGISEKDQHILNVLAADWHVDALDLELRKELGRGAFGRVLLGKWRNTMVAVKITHPLQGDVSRGIENNAHLYREVGMMMRVHHPNIVQYLGFSALAATDGGGGGGVQPCIVMEFIDGRTLEKYIRKDLPSGALHVSQRTKRRLCFEMTLALEYLHGRRPAFITHRDLKPENFMLTRALHVKLTDFGISRLFGDAAEGHPAATTSETSERSQAAGGATPQNPNLIDYTQTSRCGTVRFMAPEVWGDGTVSGGTMAPQREARGDGHDGTAPLVGANLDDNGGDRGGDGAAVGEKAVTRYSTAADMFSLGLVYFFVFEVRGGCVEREER